MSDYGVLSAAGLMNIGSGLGMAPYGIRHIGRIQKGMSPFIGVGELRASPGILSSEAINR
jgi:hypothetical protein